MLRTICLCAAVSIFAISGPLQAAGQDAAGEIVLIRGGATVTQDGQTVRLYRGASVIVGDQLRTARNARVKLRMIDGTEIMLGENSEFTVREYSMNTAAGTGTGALELTRGFFRAITGKITKLRENSFQVKTPLAIVGVRGTDFWGEQHPNKLRVAMLSGTAIVVSNDFGSVEITEAGFGTEITVAGQAPRAPFRWTAEEIQKAAGTVN